MDVLFRCCVTLQAPTSLDALGDPFTTAAVIVNEKVASKDGLSCSLSSFDLDFSTSTRRKWLRVLSGDE